MLLVLLPLGKAQAADTTVDAAVFTQLFEVGIHGVWGPYYTSTTVGAIVYRDATALITVAKTVDGGVDAFGASATTVESSDAECIAVWFDQETPGDTGTLLNIFWLDSDGGDAHYRTYDISDASLGTLRTLDASVVGISETETENKCALTKTVGGNLLAAWLTPSEIEVMRSTDSGANWTDQTDVHEAATEEDSIMFFPANTADNDDAVAVYWDMSADIITFKMYDDSANAGAGSWTETSSVLTAMVDDIANGHGGMDCAVRHSDKFVLCAAHSNNNNSTDDLKTFSIDPSVISSPTTAVHGDVYTNVDEGGEACVFINQQNDDVYVAWLGSNTTWHTTVDAVYDKSTDDMATWVGESVYSEGTADDLRDIHCGRTVGNNGGFFQPVFYNDDLADIFINLVNDVPIAASTGRRPHAPIIFQ